MIPSLIVAALGLLLVIIGIINMKGNISSLHSYHRYRVSEEDVKPFGKAVGLGTVICGVSCAFFGAMLLVYELTKQEIFSLIGVAGLMAGLVVGIVISLKAINKYNKGIF